MWRAKKCKVKRCKSTGRPCPNPAVKGFNVCKVHGAGTKKRVREGKRKPPGRPITSGTDADPNHAKNKAGVLGDYMKRYDTDPTIMNPRRQVAIATAALDAVVHRYLADPASWDVLKTMSQFGPVQEHPESWMIKQAERVQNILGKALAAAFADEIKAAITLLKPAVKHFYDCIDLFVPAERRAECRKWISDKLAGIAVETQ